jgi:proteasome accessory factor A
LLLFQRLVGLETEYALRYHPQQPGTRRPANAALFERLLVKIRGRVAAVRSALLLREWFLANGGMVRLEAHHAYLVRPESGLVEGATPECRGPRQLLRHQRAQDVLLSRAAAADDVNGQMTLLKHNCDSRGNFYGSHENYELVLARGVLLGLWRLGVALLTPVVLLLGIAIILAFFLALAVGRLAFAAAAAWQGLWRKDGEKRSAALRMAGLTWLRILLLPLVLSVVAGTEAPKTWPVLVAIWTPVVLVLAGAIGLGLLLALAVGRPGSAAGEDRLAALEEAGLRGLLLLRSLPLTLPWLLLQPLAFRRQRRQLLAFLISRPVLAGAGTVGPDGRFGLSPRAPAITAVNSVTSSYFRPVFYFGHIFKQMVFLLAGDVGAYRQLFRQRQRLQITVGDANMAQTAEYLKIGTTLLVLDAIEAGALTEAPRLRRPLRALRTFCADPDLRARVRLKNGQSCTALAIQRFYLDACRRFVDQVAAPHPEADEVLRVWEETLDALEHDPDRLIGKLDWVTKRYLLDDLGPQASVAAKRKLDLRYHELSRDGYYLRLEAAGAAPTVVEPEEVLQAIEVPPEGTPATLRGQLIREFAQSPEQVHASWHSVSIKDGPRTRVVKLS